MAKASALLLAATGRGAKPSVSAAAVPKRRQIKPLTGIRKIAVPRSRVRGFRWKWSGAESECNTDKLILVQRPGMKLDDGADPIP